MDEQSDEQGTANAPETAPTIEPAMNAVQALTHLVVGVTQRSRLPSARHVDERHRSP
jgi:hypothetical protein